MKRKKEFFGVLISVLISVFLVSLAVYATTTIGDTVDSAYYLIDGTRILHNYGANNTFFGVRAGNLTETGYGGNVAVGEDAFGSNTTGYANTAVGYYALWANTEGYQNAAVGEIALVANTTGDNNTAMGESALWSNIVGNNNTALGMEAGNLAVGSGNVFLGYQAGAQETGSNTLYIDNSDTTTPLIYGEFDNDYLLFNGRASISGNFEVDGTAYFADDVTMIEDVNITWGDAADKMVITQTDTTGIASQPLIGIDDDRTGEFANSAGEATIEIDAAGTYALYLKAGAFYNTGFSTLAGDVTFNEDVNLTWTSTADKMVITQTQTTGVASTPLISIADERIGTNANEVDEATLVIDADGTYALYLKDGDFWNAGDSSFVGNATFNEDINVTWADALDKMVISQSNTTGTASTPLINIDDDRTGENADTVDEATIVLNAAGTYGLYVQTGAVQFDGDLTVNGILGYGSVVDLVIDGEGAVSITRSYHKITVAGGTGSGNDDLTTITSGTEGQIIIIRPATSGGSDTVTVKDGTGNIQLDGDFIMNHVNDTLMLIYNGSNWLEISRTSND